MIQSRLLASTFLGGISDLGYPRVLRILAIQSALLATAFLSLWARAEPAVPPSVEVTQSCGNHVVASDGSVDHAYAYDSRNKGWQRTTLLGRVHRCCGGQIITRNKAGVIRLYRYHDGWQMRQIRAGHLRACCGGRVIKVNRAGTHTELIRYDHRTRSWRIDRLDGAYRTCCGGHLMTVRHDRYWLHGWSADKQSWNSRQASGPMNSCCKGRIVVKGKNRRGNAVYDAYGFKSTVAKWIRRRLDGRPAGCCDAQIITRSANDRLSVYRLADRWRRHGLGSKTQYRGCCNGRVITSNPSGTTVFAHVFDSTRQRWVRGKLKGQHATTWKIGKHSACCNGGVITLLKEVDRVGRRQQSYQLNDYDRAAGRWTSRELTGDYRGCCKGRVVTHDGLYGNAHTYVYHYDRQTNSWPRERLPGTKVGCCSGTLVTRDMSGYRRAHTFDGMTQDWVSSARHRQAFVGCCSQAVVLDKYGDSLVLKRDQAGQTWAEQTLHGTLAGCHRGRLITHTDLGDLLWVYDADSRTWSPTPW